MSSSALIIVALALLASVKGQQQVSGQGHIYDICKDSTIDPRAQKFTVISPKLGSPGGYQAFQRCHIDYGTTTTPRILRLTFPSFNLEKGAKCEHDSLRIGAHAMLCGTWPQGKSMDFLVLPGKTFSFEFISDGTGGHPGFIMNVQVGNYNPNAVVLSYAGRGDTYDAGSFDKNSCNCGTGQVLKAACSCNSIPSALSKAVTSRAAPRYAFRNGNALTNGLVSAWAANQMARMGQQGQQQQQAPRSQAYNHEYFKRVSNSLTDLLNKGHQMSRDLTQKLNALPVLTGPPSVPQNVYQPIPRTAMTPGAGPRMGPNMGPSMGPRQYPGQVPAVRPPMMRPGMPGMMPQAGVPAGLFGGNRNSLFNNLMRNTLMGQQGQQGGEGGSAGGSGGDDEGGAGGEGGSAGGEGGAQQGQGQGQGQWGQSQWGQRQGGWANQFGGANNFRGANTFGGTNNFGRARYPYRNFGGPMTTTSKPEENEGGAPTPPPSPWGAPPQQASGGEDDDEGGSQSTPAPGMGGFYGQQPRFGAPRGFPGQNPRSPYGGLPFPVMQGPGRYPGAMPQMGPRQMPFNPQMGRMQPMGPSYRYPMGQMGQMGPQFGRPSPYGQQRFGSQQQQRQPQVPRDPFAPQIGPGGEISTHEASPGGEQD